MCLNSKCQKDSIRRGIKTVKFYELMRLYYCALRRPFHIEPAMFVDVVFCCLFSKGCMDNAHIGYGKDLR